MFQHMFDAESAKYAEYRPRYPKALYEFVCSQVEEPRRMAWDAGTGNGQAAVALADYFEKIVATDSSEEQISRAVPHARVQYQLLPAEDCDFVDESVDLVTAANAVHWFDLDKFYEVVDRALRKNGVIALWCYSGLSCESPTVDAAFRDLAKLVDNHWSHRNQLVHDKYATLPFPFKEIAAPDFTLDVDWTLPQLIGYVSTWSARQNYLNDTGHDPLQIWSERHEALLADTTGIYQFHFPLHMRIGRK